MSKIDTYKHLDAGTTVSVELSMPEIAKRVCALNYGSHRLLSAMVHEMRANYTGYVKRVDAEDAKKPENQRRNLSAEDRCSPLADAIEAALNAGHYY